MSGLTIIEKSATILVAEQSPPSVPIFALIPTLVAACAAVAVLLKRKWVLGLFLVVLAAGLSLMLLPGAAYRITVNRSVRTISWEKRQSGKVEAQEAIGAANIQSADMDFNRNARNIILMSRDGRQYFPLGNQHFTGEPEQAVVLAAIRKLIGQNAVGESTTQTLNK